eukprot:TRINITY_DN6563_c0_g1_i4.p2 TRINITY_DN6563_c0_g1~~TRINITY_DN6563_c0_g1_i4.p2  ORF type:complete len:139 (-),score=30.24 TRINITY_DN6563_c0_g1_i4:76-492(-)
MEDQPLPAPREQEPDGCAHLHKTINTAHSAYMKQIAKPWFGRSAEALARTRRYAQSSAVQLCKALQQARVHAGHRCKGIRAVMEVVSALLSTPGRTDVEQWVELQTQVPVSYTHLRAHETPEHLVCRLLLEKKKITLI